MSQYKIINSDCLEYIRSLQDETIDFVITSPPYNIGKEYETKRNIDEYLSNMGVIISELYRVLKSNGSICWQIGNYVDNGEVFPLDIYFYTIFKKLGMKLRNRIIWHFGHGLHCSKRFSGRYETILWFTKSDEYTFNLDDVRIPQKYPNKKYFKGDKYGELSCNPLGKNPEDVWSMSIDRLYDDWERCVWDISNVKNNHPEKLDHPCQFPVELVERCILACTNENDVVYDPFCGVGSTLVASILHNRVGIGTELDVKYCSIAQDRLNSMIHGKMDIKSVFGDIHIDNTLHSNKNKLF